MSSATFQFFCVLWGNIFLEIIKYVHNYINVKNPGVTAQLLAQFSLQIEMDIWVVYVPFLLWTALLRIQVLAFDPCFQSVSGAYIPRSGFIEPHWMFFLARWKFQSIVCKGHTILIFFKQCFRVLISLHCCCPLSVLVFRIYRTVACVRRITLWFSFAFASGLRMWNILLCLLTICVSHLEKVLFQSILQIQSLVFLFMSCTNSLSTVDNRLLSDI